MQPISQSELMALDKDLKEFMTYYGDFRRDNKFQAAPYEFRDVVRRIEELLIVGRNIEQASKERAF